MDFHLDTLLNFPNATVEQCIQEAGEIFLTLRLLNDATDCPSCGQSTEELHQSRPVLLRDLSIFGQATHLEGVLKVGPWVKKLTPCKLQIEVSNAGVRR